MGKTSSVAVPLTYNADGSINLPSNGDRYLPVVGDVIRCEDGTNYRISDVSQYEWNLCDLRLTSNPFEGQEGEIPEAEAIHYSDVSGDYLFIRNIYETLRMLYYVQGLAGEDIELTVRMSIPETAPADTFWPWDPKQIEAIYVTAPDKIYCVEAWDMFKNGKFFRTSYQIAVIQTNIS